MERQPLDVYDDMPKDMKRYISNYGWHFNKKAYEYATKYMKPRIQNTKPFTKDYVQLLLNSYNVFLKDDMHDATYVAYMGACDYFGSAIADERHLALFVKDTMEDEDANTTIPFRRWVATMVGMGIPIDWEELV